MTTEIGYNAMQVEITIPQALPRQDGLRVAMLGGNRCFTLPGMTHILYTKQNPPSQHVLQQLKLSNFEPSDGSVRIPAGTNLCVIWTTGLKVSSGIAKPLESMPKVIATIIDVPDYVKGPKDKFVLASGGEILKIEPLSLLGYLDNTDRALWSPDLCSLVDSLLKLQESIRGSGRWKPEVQIQ